MLYITYELEQDTGGSVVMRGAKELDLSGPVGDPEVGQFENASGKKVYGVRVQAGGRVEVVELPANAMNVTVHEGSLPDEFRDALDSAA